MITNVTEKETRLSNMLTACTEALKQVTAERDKLERSIDQWRVDYHELQLDYEKLAGELKALRDSDVALPEPSIKLHGKHKSGKLSDESIGMFMEDELRDYGDRRAMVERERMSKDAARYQWLREQDDHSPVFCMYGSNGPWGECGHSDIYGELLDKSIDAAMKEPS